MSRRVIALSSFGLALALVASGCGGSDPKADPPSPTPSASTPSSPTTAPTPTAQPSGANGVTVRIVNWDAYADNPAVLAWKSTFEALEASANQHRLLPGLVQGTTGSVRRLYLQGVHLGWANHWHVPDLAFVRVQSAQGGATRSTLTMCAWEPSVSYFKKNGDAVVATPKHWTRWLYTMRTTAGQWVISNQRKTGTCPGGAPQ